MKTELTWSEMEQRRRMKDLYTGFFVITILIWVLRFLLSLVSGLLPDYGFYGTSVLSILSEAVSVLIPFCLYRKFARDPFRDLFREKVRSEHPVLRTLIGIFASVGLSVAGFCGCYCLISFCELHGVHTAVSLPSVGQTVPEFLFYLILSSVVFGFVYEFSFRGIACSAMKSANRICAVFVSSLCFALCDGDLYHIWVRLLISVPLGFFYLRVHSLIPCMIFQAVSQSVVSLLIFFGSRCPEPYRMSVSAFLAVAGAVVGVVSAVAFFYPRRKPDPEAAPARLGFKMIFSSFGVYALLALLCFALLVNTFSTDSDPSDPLLQPTPEEGQHPDFGRKEPLQFYPPDSDSDPLE